tara:strand:- start:8019 stop:9254 length:1236 start_codon:yes stop_codon:yes gene_type:complete
MERPSTPLPLDGITVIDFSRLLPGPWCTQFLSDLGAKVIKVEQAGIGDMSRYNAPRQGNSSVYFELVNGGKRSIELDLSTDDGQKIAHRLIGGADVVVESFRPGVTGKLGISYEAAKETKPDIVYCSITGFGQEGPLAHISGHDLAIQSVAGHMPLGKLDGHTQQVPGFQAADYAGASTACSAVLAALIRRDRTGDGAYIDLAMYDSLFSMCNIAMTGAIGAALPNDPGDRLEAWGANPRYAVYETKDGKAVAVALLESRLWQAFCAAIGRPDLADPNERPDARHSTHGDLREKYRVAIEDYCAARTRDEIVEFMNSHGVPICPVLSPEEALDSANVTARGLIDVHASGQSRIVHMVNPLASSGLARATRTDAPSLGGDTETVLADLGYEAEEIAGLRSKGVLGPSKETNA